MSERRDQVLTAEEFSDRAESFSDGEACAWFEGFLAGAEPSREDLEQVLSTAICHDMVGLVHRVIDRGVALNPEDDPGEWLSWAVCCKSPHALRALLERGARLPVSDGPTDCQDIHSSPLHDCVATDARELGEVLLASASASQIDVCDREGSTALERAVWKKSMWWAVRLLEAGAAVDASSERIAGFTPLDTAVAKQSLPMVKLLLAHGASPHKPTWMRVTALDRAEDRAERRRTETALEILRLLRAVEHEEPLGPW